MNIQDARRLVKDKLFELTHTSLADHLWGLVPLAQIDVDPETWTEMLKRLGVAPREYSASMTPGALAQIVLDEHSARDAVGVEPKTMSGSVAADVCLARPGVVVRKFGNITVYRLA